MVVPNSVDEADLAPIDSDHNILGRRLIHPSFLGLAMRNLEVGGVQKLPFTPFGILGTIRPHFHRPPLPAVDRGGPSAPADSH